MRPSDNSFLYQTETVFRTLGHTHRATQYIFIALAIPTSSATQLRPGTHCAAAGSNARGSTPALGRNTARANNAAGSTTASAPQAADQPATARPVNPQASRAT